MSRSTLAGAAGVLAQVLVAGAVLPGLAAAQFEGVIYRQAITVDRQALAQHDEALNEALLDSPASKLLALREALAADGAIDIVQTTIYLAGDRMRVEAEGEQGRTYSIVDLRKGVSYFVLPDQKEYVELTKAELNPTGNQAEPSALQVVALKRSQEVAGMQAAGYEVENDTTTVRVWVTNDRPALSTAFKRLTAALNQFTPNGDSDPEVVIGGRHGFPVLIQRIDQDTYQVEQVTSIEVRAVPADRFALPADFTRRTMKELMAEADGN